MALGNLAQRALVAVVAVPILIVILHYHRHEPTWGLLFVASLIAMHEFFAMTLPKEDRIPALAFGALACIALYWLDFRTVVQLASSGTGWTTYEPFSMTHAGDGGPGPVLRLISGMTAAATPILLVLAVIVPGLYYLFRFRDIPSVAGRFTATVTGIVYAGFLTTVLAMLKRIDPERGASTVLIVLVVAWVSDTGAYFAGRFLGKSKLYEAVSPKKTWAGFWGGIAGSVGGLIALKFAYADWLTWVDVFAIAIPGNLLGQMGDLAESLLKRSVGVKDSGALLPGHGGILDRIDAVLFIAPYVYAYLMIKQAL
jgi:phosphatidate cytidylyltransferase